MTGDPGPFARYGFHPTEAETKALMDAARTVGATDDQCSALEWGWLGAGCFGIEAASVAMAADAKRMDKLATELAHLLAPSLQYGFDEGLPFRSEQGDIAERILPDLARLAAIGRASAQRPAWMDGMTDPVDHPKERERVVQRCCAEWRRLGQEVTQSRTWEAFANAFVCPIARRRNRSVDLPNLRWTGDSSAREVAKEEMKRDGRRGQRGPKRGNGPTRLS